MATGESGSQKALTISGSPCTYWLSNSFLISPFPFPSTDGFGTSQGYITVPQQVVGVEYGLQATFLSPLLRSNAVRIVVGGAL